MRAVRIAILVGGALLLAIEGDTVQVVSGVLLIDGDTVPEPCLDPASSEG